MDTVFFFALFFLRSTADFVLSNRALVGIVELCAVFGRWYPSPCSSLLYRDFDTTKYGAVDSSGEFLRELRREVNVAVRFIGEGFEGMVADWWGVVGCVVEEGSREECWEEGRGEGSNMYADSAVGVGGRKGNGFGGGWFGGFRFVGLVWCGFCRSTSDRAWGGH